MKKKIALLLAITCTISLTGCSQLSSITSVFTKEQPATTTPAPAQATTDSENDATTDEDKTATMPTTDEVEDYAEASTANAEGTEEVNENVVEAEAEVEEKPAAEAENTQAEEYPQDLFYNDPPRPETPTPTPTPTVAVNPLVELTERLNSIQNSDDLIRELHKSHDNSSYNIPEGLANYVGQIALENVHYCVSSKTGVEDDEVMRERLNKTMIKHAFVYEPTTADDIHEYFDMNGNLLFTIEELDFIDGKSVGKYRVRIPGQETGITFYDNDIDIALLEEFDKYGEDRKAEIGKKTYIPTDAELQSIVQKNAQLYREPQYLNHWISDEKLNSITFVDVLLPKHKLANEEGYVRITPKCKYIQHLLKQQYVKKGHNYRITNIKNYVVYRDKDGNQVFSMNISNKTKAIDISRKKPTIEEGYRRAKIIKTYPATVDIEQALLEEEQLILEENGILDTESEAEEGETTDITAEAQEEEMTQLQPQT